MRIGTRGSALALAQAAWVCELLGGDSELVTVVTSGDRGLHSEDKSRWTSELEQALLQDRIDIAVHSAKDVPAELAEGLELVAFPQRASPYDTICGAASLQALKPGARVGTSSPRRGAQIRALREDIELVPITGNVDTRLRKLADGQCDALVLALAGLQRLGRAHEAGGVLEELVPAAGQGALALEARAGALSEQALSRVSDTQCAVCVSAERELVRALGASCDTPIGAHARAIERGELEMLAWVGVPDGSAWLSDRLRGPAERIGLEIAERLLACGAGEILAQAREVSK